MNTENKELTKKDFMSDQAVRWCPGCGDYSILSQMQTTLADLNIPPHEVAIISGIGCSSRFPYYMNTYGFHTIHGRAPSVATGVKLANPDLSVWIMTGDGDGMSIGGNHLIHVLRRNVDLQLVLFNNEIYGLTKGQYSPTSEVGKRTKSTPMGSIDHPFTPCALALGADASFVARTTDLFVKEQREVLKQSTMHKGASFIEILQNCLIFNDGAFKDLTDRKVRGDNVIFVEHGERLLFGAKNSPKKGLRVNSKFEIEVVEVENDGEEENILVHDETNSTLANLLARMAAPLPVAMGILYRIERSTYEAVAHQQIETAKAAKPVDIQATVLGGNTWTVEKS